MSIIKTLQESLALANLFLHDIETVIRRNEIKDQKEQLYTEPTDEELNQNIDSINTCITCNHRLRNTVIVDCGHSVLCTVCSKQLVTTSTVPVCPICRKKIKKIQKIYSC